MIVGCKLPEPVSPLSPPAWIVGTWTDQFEIVTWSFTIDNVLWTTGATTIDFKASQSSEVTVFEVESATTYTVSMRSGGVTQSYTFEKIDATTLNWITLGMQLLKVPVSVTGVTVSPTSIALRVGNTGQLTATVLPADATVKSVWWSTSNADVATVNDSGLVAAVGIGSASITVTTIDAGRTAQCTVTVFDHPVPPTTPSPSNGSTVSDPTPLLDWEDMAGATAYRVQLNTNAGFTGTMVAESIGLSSSQFQVTPILADGDSYYWRVRVKNVANEWSSWSGPWSFTVNLVAPGSPIPSNDSTIYDATPLLNWGDAAGAAKYHLQLSTDAGFAGALVAESSNLVNSQFQVSSALADATTYHWRVRVDFGGTWGPWSSVWNFTVDTSHGTVVKVITGGRRSFVITSDGILWGCGANGLGELGNGTPGDLDAFTPLMDDVRTVSAGMGHVLVVKNDNTLWAAGLNDVGQLGTGDTANRQEFTLVLSGVATVDAGSVHTLALKTDGTLWACGRNDWGQLGTGDNGNRSTFTLVLSGVATISAGGYHSLVVKSDGGLWASGINCYGQLGRGNTTDSNAFIHIMDEVGSVSAGMHHSLALRNDGTLLACGYSYGSSFTEMLTGVGSVSTEYHLLALKLDNTLWACGGNAYGGLGTGDNIDRSTFVEVITNVTSFSAGDGHSVVALDDGSLLTCGYNNQGQLGMGDFTDRNVFTEVW
jgi:alpha-tubulin suppressor-like RCC1 family protein